MNTNKTLTLASLLLAASLAGPAAAQDSKPAKDPAVLKEEAAQVEKGLKAKGAKEVKESGYSEEELTARRRAAKEALEAKGDAPVESNAERMNKRGEGAVRGIGVSRSGDQIQDVRIHEFEIANGALDIYNRGVMLMQRGAPDASIEFFRNALEETPEFPEAHANLSYALRLVGGDGFEEALAHAQQAVSLAPEMPEGHLQSGMAKIYLGELEGAAKDEAALRALEPSVYTAALADELSKAIEAGQEVEAEKSPHNPVIRPNQIGYTQANYYFAVKERAERMGARGARGGPAVEAFGKGGKKEGLRMDPTTVKKREKMDN